MRTDWRLIGLLFVAGLLAAGQFAKISLGLADLATAYPDRTAYLPYLVSTLSVVGVLFGATAGALVARYGPRRVLLSGLFLGAVLSLGQSAVPQFAVFLVLRLLEGVSQLAIVVAAPTIMATVAAPSDKPVVMGIWGTFFGVGFAVAALAAPPLMSTGGAPLMIAAHGCALGILGLALWPLLPRVAVQKRDHEGWLARHTAIYTSLSTIAPALLFFWHTTTFLALLTFLPGWLGLWAGSVLPLIALIGTLGAGVLSRRMSPLTVSVVGYAATVGLLVVILALPEAARTWVALPLFVAIGLAPGAAFAAVPALNASPQDQARANGAIAQCGNIGTAISTPIFALTLGAGLSGLVTLAAALSACGLIVAALIHRKMRAT